MSDVILQQINKIQLHDGAMSLDREYIQLLQFNSQHFQSGLKPAAATAA